MSESRWDFDTVSAPAGPPTPHRDSPPVGPPNQPHHQAPRPGAFGYADPAQGAERVRTAAEPETVVVEKTAGWGWRALVAFLAGGALVAGGFGVAQLKADPESTVSARPSASASGANGSGPSADEPVAFVAEILGPSVVKIETNLGLGSGIVIDPVTVITNNHVVDGADSLLVRLADGTAMRGEVIGANERIDVAVIRVPDGSDLPPAELVRGEELEVGQLTVAIGSPFDLQQTVTSGVISALDRPVQTTESTINAMIQTDTAINPGNSGGALADRFGRVIGMNTLIQTDGQSNTNIGVGFATPIDTVMKVVDRIIAGEDQTPGFMGLVGEEDAGGLPGVVVVEVTAGSGSEKAGIVPGDRVLRIDGAPVSAIQELAGLVQSSFPGDTVVIDLMRGGQEISVDVVLGER